MRLVASGDDTEVQVTPSDLSEVFQALPEAEPHSPRCLRTTARCPVS